MMIINKEVRYLIRTDIPVYLDEQVETPPVPVAAAIDSSGSAAKNSVAFDCRAPLIASATNAVAPDDSTVPALNAVVADGAYCPVASTTNSLHGDHPEEDDVDMSVVAKHGVKRRWSFEENTVFKRAFQDALLYKKKCHRERKFCPSPKK